MGPRGAAVRLLLLAVVAAAAPRWAAAAAAEPSGAEGLLVGIGKADITGPIAEVELMAYANINQTAKGLHTRLWARAFAFAEPPPQQQQDTGKSAAAAATKRFMLVHVDAAMVPQMLTARVARRLSEEFGAQSYAADGVNLVITPTHTHAAPGGFLEHLLYHFTSLGFVQESFDAMLDGVLEACRAAHADLRPAELSWAEGELLGANVNRSPSAYEANPPEERARYAHDVDKEMTALRIKGAADGRGRAMLTFFPVHATSMANTNRLVSGDNKGFAQLAVERRWAPLRDDLEPGFVAAFAQTNHADTSPNINGTFCVDTGLPCDYATSTCGGRNDLCFGRGPAADDTQSTAVIGQRQADKAQELWDAPGQAIAAGPLDYRRVWLDMFDTKVEADGAFVPRNGSTCPGAMGYGFAAGTTDGPGAAGFHQGDAHSGITLPWGPVSHVVNAALLASPGAAQTACQSPKPILLNVGSAPAPYAWVPRTAEVTVLRLGRFVMVAVPGEFTTMAGRRLRAAVRDVLAKAWGSTGGGSAAEPKVVLLGLSNTYNSYVTTYEEYGQQRYEGGSTLYGPHTHAAYVQAAVRAAEALARGAPAPPRPASAALPSPDPPRHVLRLLPGPAPDLLPPHAAAFGAVAEQPPARAVAGRDVASAMFWSANPRNNLRRGGTFLEVQRRRRLSGEGGNGGDEWEAVASDDGWETRLLWHRPYGQLVPMSTAKVEWAIPSDAAPGTYRLLHYGDARPPAAAVAAVVAGKKINPGSGGGSAAATGSTGHSDGGELQPFVGVSNSFEVVAAA